jgi:hypothetical protein
MGSAASAAREAGQAAQEKAPEKADFRSFEISSPNRLILEARALTTFKYRPPI